MYRLGVGQQDSHDGNDDCRGSGNNRNQPVGIGNFWQCPPQTDGIFCHLGFKKFPVLVISFIHCIHAFLLYSHLPGVNLIALTLSGAGLWSSLITEYRSTTIMNQFKSWMRQLKVINDTQYEIHTLWRYRYWKITPFVTLKSGLEHPVLF